MALTQLNSEGIKDSEVKQADLNGEAVNEAKLQISNAGTNGQFLQKQSGNAGGLTWADAASEGTSVKSTGESGGSKYLREDGDGTSSWQSIPAGVGGATGVDFNDSVETRWGTGNDLQIYHDATNSWIVNKTGNLNIYAKHGEYGAIIKPDAGVELYYDNTKKIETTSAGVTVTGDLTVTGSAPVASIGTSGNYTGSHVIFGTNAGAYTSSNYKICIGYQAGQYGTGRHNNTFIGVNAGRGNSDGTSSTGDSNCCIGDYAGEDLTSGSSNTIIGPNAGKDVTSGNSNVIIGYSAGNTANDIHGTVIIGPSSGYGLDESNYSVIIGHGASGETLQGDAADNQLFIARQGYGGGSDGTWIYGNSSGQCQQGGGSSSWYTGSDERYKDFLGKYSRGLAEINALDVQNFKWKDKDKMPAIAFNNSGSYCGPTIDGKTKIGIGAQSCEKVIPEAVNKLEPIDLDKGGNHMLTLDNDPIFWAMVNAIQELSAKVTALENA